LVACGVSAPSASPVPSVPEGWRTHDVPASDVSINVPAEWLALGDDELDDPASRAKLEDRFPGARGLFAAIEGQGDRVDLQFLSIDPAGRGSPGIPATVTVVGVEPRVPSIGLEIGTGLVLDGLDATLEMETEPRTSRITTPVGDAMRFSFDHRVVDDPADAGVRARLDGALVTTETSSFLVLRNVDSQVDDPLLPSLETVLGTLRALP
jgi:hypothetical protein